MQKKYCNTNQLDTKMTFISTENYNLRHSTANLYTTQCRMLS